jgi:hypothetical protein
MAAPSDPAARLRIRMRAQGVSSGERQRNAQHQRQSHESQGFGHNGCQYPSRTWAKRQPQADLACPGAPPRKRAFRRRPRRQAAALGRQRPPPTRASDARETSFRLVAGGRKALRNIGAGREELADALRRECEEFHEAALTSTVFARVYCATCQIFTPERLTDSPAVTNR